MNPDNIIFTKADVKAAQGVMYDLLKTKLHRPKKAIAYISIKDLQTAMYHVASNRKYAKYYQNFAECMHVLKLCFSVIIQNQKIHMIQDGNQLCTEDVEVNSNQHYMPEFTRNFILIIIQEISQNLNTQIELFN